MTFLCWGYPEKETIWRFAMSLDVYLNFLAYPLYMLTIWGSFWSFLFFYDYLKEQWQSKTLWIKDMLVLFNGWRPRKYLAHSLWPRGKVTKNSETQNEWATILKKWKVHCVTVVNQEGMLEASICRVSSSSCTDAGIGDAYSALMLFQVCKCFCK